MNEKPNSATSMQGRRMAGARALWHANGMTREQKKSPPVRKVTFTQGSDSGAIRTHSLEGCCSIQLSYGTLFFAVAKIGKVFFLPKE